MDETGKKALKLGEGEIYAAHPMNMKEEDISLWKKYFTDRNLKQPFKQIWERVIDLKYIPENTYKYARLYVYKLSGKEKHGINAADIRAYSEDFSFELKDIEMDYEVEVLERWDARSFSFILGSIKRVTKKSRYANHIIGILDDWTFDQLAEKIVMEHDVTVRGRLETLTLEQIDKLLEIAGQNGVADVSAVLLEYKHEHFQNDDVFDDFTLDI